jgi:hypothetical protein
VLDDSGAGSAWVRHEGEVGGGEYQMSKLWKALACACVLVAGLLAPAAANATITSVFGSVTCTTQGPGASVGQRWCGNTAGTTVKTWDGETPIDVSVAFPAETGSDNNWPVIGLYHGWGSTKILPSSATAQRWLNLGYAVFSMTDRGWGSSCGSPSKPANSLKAPPCEHGYIHLMSRKYEVRDAQYLLGLLADEGVINPQEIGANGGSYGGGMSLQLGSLKDRVELLNGEYVPWTSPKGTPMKIAATAPEYPWTDLAQSLQPNGSDLDYVAEAPYSGMLGNHEYGIEKNNWNGSLYLAGQLLGYYAPTSLGEPEANLVEWHNFNITGGPYNGKPLAIQQEAVLPTHGAYYTDLSEPPAPSLMENGWNDDLFPADNTTDYYNKVRAKYPAEQMKIFDLDIGHNPRSATVLSTSDTAKFQAAQNEWMKFFVKGEGSEPAEARGGVTAITSFCPASTSGSGKEIKAANWASLERGEVRLEGSAEQTIQAPGTAPTQAFTTATVCTTQAAGNNASAATYKLAPAPAAGFTIAGASTVIGEFSTPAENGQIIARLYDVNEAAGGTQQLIGRAIYRPISPGGGFVKQVFQLHPQAWTVAAGHVIKLELLAQDSTYARTSSTPRTIQVKNLELRIPTTEAPGSDEGLVKAPAVQYLPPGYTFARDEATSAPGTPHLTSGSSPNNNGVFTLAWEASQAATALTYTLEHKNAAGGWSTVASGLSSPEYAFTAGSPEAEGTWKYRVIANNEGPASEPSGESSPGVVVDESAPAAPTASADRAPDFAGGGGWFKDTVEVSFSANGDPALSDGSPGSGVNAATLSAPVVFNTSGSHTANGTVADNAGNTSGAGSLTVQVDATPPSVEVSCPEKVNVGEPAEATVSASDGQSGLAHDPSGTVPIDTSKGGPQTVTRTAIDNVGHEASGSCTTQVEFNFPGAPMLSAGSNPSSSGLFTLSWTGEDPMTNLGLTYTLQHHDAASAEWTTVATEIAALQYEFTGAGEAEGTWVYRVEGSNGEQVTGFSPPSEPVVVDESAPAAPTASADRAPDFAGGGGWYKDSVKVSFSANGDPALADGSPGSGVNGASLSGPVVFSTSGSHLASGTVADNAGNVSVPGTLAVQVDATPPSVEVSCPVKVQIGSSASATVTASDGESGLAHDPSGTVAIDTSKAGPQTITRTASDNVGHETSASCTTEVGYTRVITNTIKGKLVVKSGEAVELTSTAKASGAVTVNPGGALDVEGATLSGSLSSKGATLLRLCGATLNGPVKALNGTGSVVMGEGGPECAANTFHGSVIVKGNQAGVLVDENLFHANLSVQGNSSGVTVTNNTIAGSLLIKNNTGTIVEHPNEVEGKSKLQ